MDATKNGRTEVRTSERKCSVIQLHNIKPKPQQDKAPQEALGEKNLSKIHYNIHSTFSTNQRNPEK
jgi:hypothetical protein